MNEQHHEQIVINTNIGVRFWKSVTNESGYVPFHWHNSIEVDCIVHGGVIFYINGRAFKVGPGEFIVVPSGVVHSVANIPNSAYVLQIPPRTVERFISHPEKYDFNNGQKNKPAYQLIVKLMKQLGYLNEYHPKGYLFDNEITFTEILKLLFMELGQPQQMNSNDTRLKNIIVYINAHFQKRLTVKELAERFSYNPNYLSRLFKNETNISLIHYIYMVKINHFYHDLTETNKPIGQLMKDNGLSNERTARNIFKEMYGCTPKTFRNKK